MSNEIATDVFGISRTVDEIEKINASLRRDRLPATAYRCGRQTVVRYDPKVDIAQIATIHAYAIDRDPVLTWARNLPPPQPYVVITDDPIPSHVVARCGDDAKRLATQSGQIARHAYPAWIDRAQPARREWYDEILDRLVSLDDDDDDEGGQP